jgi:hypothetical protein
MFRLAGFYGIILDIMGMSDSLTWVCASGAFDDGPPPKVEPTRLDRWPFWAKALLTLAVGYASVKLTLLLL